jgi:hypothetical protein
MNRIVIFILLLFSFSTSGKEVADTLSAKKISRFYFGINISADNCYRTLTKNDNTVDSLWNYARNIEDSIEIPKFGYTAGISFGYEFTRRLSAEAGIQYSNKGYRTIPIETEILFDPDYGTLARNTISFIYLDFPLKVNYTFFDKRVKLITSLGVTVNVLLKSTFRSVPEDKGIEEFYYVSDYPYNKINISPEIGIGIKYKINDRMNLILQPAFRYGILGLDDKSYKTTHLWSAGLSMGYYCKF